MQPNLEELSGLIHTLNLVPMRKERKAYEEKSKPRRKKKDYSEERSRKRGIYE